MVAQDTTASPSYDPENLGAWDGQLPHADLVDQFPPADTVHPLPDLDNTVKTLFYLGNGPGHTAWPTAGAADHSPTYRLEGR